MAKFNLNLREVTSTQQTKIHLVIRWQKNRLVFPTRESINPKFWETDKEKKNFQRGKETKQFPEYPEFNARLDKIIQDAKNVFRKYENDNQHQQPTVEVLRELLNEKLNPETTNNGKDFFSFVAKYREEAKTRINDKTEKVFSTSTIQVYDRCIELLKLYAKTGKGKRIDFDTIDLNFYRDYTDYLNKVHKFKPNTIGKQFKIIKTFLNEATERGVNTNLAFKSKRFKVTKQETDSIYLNEKELEEIFDKDLSNDKKLERVRDLFLVGCWTGLRFSDFSNIKPENIDGDFIEITTQKTAEPVVIPIHSTVKKIMAKYKGETANSLPPSISNQKMNDYLKDLGKLIDGLKTTVSVTEIKGGVEFIKNVPKHDLITTHTARRSFASNLFVQGLSSSNIMKITGHKTEKSFMRYIKITPKENAKVLQLFWQNKNKLKVV